MTEKHISTTALARLLNKESKELFVLLTGGGWIVKVDNHWQLTEKGRFEGGIYVNHPKYGEYIAWPESIQHHHLLKLLPEAPLTATNLGHKWNIPARLVNLLLAEKGLIKKHLRGWLLTEKGKKFGGKQQKAEQSAIPFVTWPETLIDDEVLQECVKQLHGDTDPQALSLDGRLVNNAMQRRINNWLYLAQISFARNYSLRFENDIASADFFLPALQMCIECWGDALEKEQDKAAAIVGDLNKQQIYKKNSLDFIEFTAQTIHEVDEILARALFERGLAVY